MKRWPILALAAAAFFAACDQADTTRPVVTIVAPTAGDTLSPALITVKAVATDDKAVTRVEFYVGNRLLGEDSTATADTFTTEWNATTDTTGGGRLLKATAFDAAGNFTEGIITVYLRRPPPRDTVKPEIRLRAPRAGDTLPRAVITLKAWARDDVKMSKVEFYVNAALVGEDLTATADTFSFDWDASSTEPGSSVVIRATAVDTAGNTRSDSVTCRITRFTGPTVHTGDITTSETWTVFAGPHIVTGTVNVRGGARLTIEPGVTVQFEADAALVIGNGGSGELVAIGTADSGIVFTSVGNIRSDTTPGFWQGIHFYGGTGPASSLSYCTITYGGRPTGGAITLHEGARVRIDRSEIGRSAGKGIAIDDQGSSVLGFSFNRITGCGSYAIETYPDLLRHFGPGNVLTPNGKEGVLVHAGAVDSSVYWPFLGTSLVIEGDVTIGSPARPVVSVASGSNIRFLSRGRILVGDNGQPGALYAVSELTPIRFVSAAGSPAPGDWGCIVFGPDAIDNQCVLSVCLIEYGGDESITDGMILIRNSVPNINTCQINNSATWGIYLDGDEYPDPDELETRNTFRGNIRGDVRRP